MPSKPEVETRPPEAPPSEDLGALVRQVAIARLPCPGSARERRLRRVAVRGGGAHGRVPPPLRPPSASWSGGSKRYLRRPPHSRHHLGDRRQFRAAASRRPSSPTAVSALASPVGPTDPDRLRDRLRGRNLRGRFCRPFGAWNADGPVFPGLPPTLLHTSFPPRRGKGMKPGASAPGNRAGQDFQAPEGRRQVLRSAYVPTGLLNRWTPSTWR
jgi:hypothetical protein